MGGTPKIQPSSPTSQRLVISIGKTRISFHIGPINNHMILSFLYLNYIFNFRIKSTTTKNNLSNKKHV